jgi:hypothetical protein
MDLVRGSVKKLARCPGCFFAKACRNQHLNLAANQFLTLVTKQILGLGIDQNDMAFLIDDDDRVRR